MVAIRKSSSSDSWLQQVEAGKVPGVGEGRGVWKNRLADGLMCQPKESISYFSQQGTASI